MDHHEQHHQQHRKEREHEKHQHHLHELAEEKVNEFRSPYPTWFLVVGSLLIVGVVLVWMYPI